MAKFIIYKVIVLLFAGVPLLFGFYGLFISQNASKLAAVSILLIGISFLVYCWDYDRWDHKLINRRKRVSNWILGAAAVVYTLKIISEYQS